MRRRASAPYADLRCVDQNCKRSEVERPRVPDDDGTRLCRATGADLSESGLHLVDHEVDDMARPFRPERPQAPEERLAGKRHVGAERDRACNVEPGPDT